MCARQNECAIENWELREEQNRNTTTAKRECEWVRVVVGGFFVWKMMEGEIWIGRGEGGRGKSRIHPSIDCSAIDWGYGRGGRRRLAVSEWVSEWERVLFVLWQTSLFAGTGERNYLGKRTLFAPTGGPPPADDTKNQPKSSAAADESPKFHLFRYLSFEEMIFFEVHFVRKR